ncbi:MAG: 2,3-bisphosphoglycerate-independent phosphoglycerate mutase [Gemmatimonadota bacterium]|nr:MAG: 2,3-bisphosphoglycerate-independent phosphoglycerate mutase [Gemmatimonadota bacterium]
MVDLQLIHQLLTPADTKIVLLVLDGLGGLPIRAGGPTELEAASTPNMDRLVSEGMAGLHQPVGLGIAPGSGPGHIGLFGYDTIRYQIGRGVLEALGVGFDLQAADLAARGNFCTIDSAGRITDRRAGRIATEKAAALCAELREIELPGVEAFVEPVREHRFLFVLRGAELAEGIPDTDPGHVGSPPLAVRAERPEAERTAELVGRFVAEAREALEGHEPANMVLLRGFARRPDWPLFPEVFGLRSVAVAQYPMYRGVGKLVGMATREAGASLDELFSTVEQVWDDYEFAFMHVKGTDKAGEDGDFDLKVAIIEEVDSHIPRLVELGPAVILVTGDHSTPAALRSHSWHPVPFLLWSPSARRDAVQQFGERWCLAGGGGLCRSEDLMPLALAHAGRLAKFGA